MMNVVDVLKGKAIEFGKRIARNVRLPRIEEQWVRQELAEIQTVAARVGEKFVDRSFLLAEVLLEQDKFDEAEEILQRIIQEQDTRKQGPDDAVTSRALERLCSVYRTRYYRLFAGDFILSSGLSCNHPTAMLESLIFLCMSITERIPSSQSLSSPWPALLSYFLDTIGRMLAWTGMDNDAVHVMQLKMEALRPDVSFSCCNVCSQELSNPDVLYFCRLCEDVTVCASCHDGTSRESTSYAEQNDTVRECFQHLVCVRRSQDERNVGNVVAGINLLFPVVLDAVHAKEMLVPSRVIAEHATSHDSKSSASKPSPADLITDSERGLLQALGPVYEDYRATTRDWRDSTMLKDDLDRKDANTYNCFIPMLGIVSKAHLTLEQRYRNGFGLHAIDDLDIAAVLAPVPHGKYGYTDEQINIFVDVATSVIESARGDYTNKDVTATAKHDKVIRTLNTVPKQVYELLGGSLDAGRIRLLELLPGSADDPIICQLINVAEDDAPAFEALSYVWGTPDPSELVGIEINERQASITPNLHCALSVLRTRKDTRLLWVDALCIHQADDIEKNNQVAKMAEIYRSASGVLIFLGDEPKKETGEDTERGPLLSFADLFSFLNRDRGDEDEEGDAARFDVIVEKMGLDEESLLEAFSDLCGREWWTRVWVLQEYSFSATDPRLILGRFQTQAKQLRLDMDVLIARRKRGFLPEHKQLRYRERYYDPLNQASGVLSTYRFRDGDNVQYEAWIYPLLLTGHSWCTDRRDVLYGRRSFFPDVAKRLFPPNYSLPIDRLYEQVAVWFLVFERGVEIFWDFPKRLSPQLPSWIPDFSQRRLMHESDVKWRVDKKKLCFDPYVAIRGGEMALEGRPIDTVSAVYPVKSSGHELVRRLWLLEMGFMALSSHYPLWKRHPLHVKFADMYSAKPLHSWCLDVSFAAQHPSTSALLLDHFAMDILMKSTTETIDIARDIFSLHGKASRDKAHEAESSTTHETGFAVAKTDGQRVEQVAEKLKLLSGFFSSPQGISNFVFPAVFDFENLVSSLRGLHSTRPSQSESRRLGINKISRIAKQILEILSDPADIMDETASVPSQGDSRVDYLFQGLPMPTYSVVQSWVTDDICCDEEEELISTILWQTAFALHNTWKRHSEADNFDDFDFLLELNQRTLAPALRQSMLHERTNMLQASILLKDRTFFVTQTGLVGVGGMGAPSVEVGDEVIMLDAAPFPMVIRSAADRPGSRNQHELVGYSHIRGLNPQEILDLPEEWWPKRHLYKIV